MATEGNTQPEADREATLRLVFDSKEARDNAAKYGAAEGARQALDSLAAYVAAAAV